MSELILPKKSRGKVRSEFCYNCKFNNQKLKVRPKCIDCFGMENNGKIVCYVNWEKGKNLTSPKRIL